MPPGFSNSEKSSDDKNKAETTSADATMETGEKNDTPVAEQDTNAEEEKPVEKKEVKEVKKTEESKENDNTKKEETKDGESAKEKPKSKLNANAKTFTFNPSAKSFTPGGGSNFAPPAAQPQHVDPNAQMHAPPMQPPHYMHPGPMGQPGKPLTPFLIL